MFSRKGAKARSKSKISKVMLKTSPRSYGLLTFLGASVLLCAVHAAPAAQVNPAWQQEWEKTVEAARKEGQVTVYISGYDAVLPDFEKEYPDIKVVAVTVRGNQLGQR